MKQQLERIRLGEILIRRRVLTEQQVFEILEQQRATRTPFGVLAERLFDVTVESIEQAWVEQYELSTGQINLDHEPQDPTVLPMISRRQAWQFEIVPLRLESSGELVMAASRRRLARAVTFVARRLTPVAYFRVAEPESLKRALMRHYPMPEVSESMREAMQRLARS